MRAALRERPRLALGPAALAPEAGAEPVAHALVEGFLAGVPERRVPHVVPEPDRLGQVLVQAQGPSDAARDPGRLERVRHARAEVVARGVDEDLRLPLQPAKSLGMEDPIAVALERRPQPALVLLAHAPVLSNPCLERISDSSLHFGHRRPSVVGCPVRTF